MSSPQESGWVVISLGSDEIEDAPSALGLPGALGGRRGALNAIFAAVILLVASYMLARSILS